MIENICHFIFGLKEQTEEFLFTYYISVYSAFIINKPTEMNFYYHYEPYGLWWEELKKIKNLYLHKVNIPDKIGKKPIKKTAHKCDKLRMDILYDKGGIYLDIDTICVKPWKHLLKGDVVLGMEYPDGICNAIMFTKPKSKFFKIWMDFYEKHFNPDGWREASIVLPYKLSQYYSNLVTIKNPDVFFLPNWNETNKIFELENDIPENLITLHLWESHSLRYIRNIKDWNWSYENSHTIYGKILLELKTNIITSIENDNKLCILTPIIGDEYYKKCCYGTLSKEYYCIENNYDLILANENDYNNIDVQNKRFGWTKVYKLLELIDKYEYIFISDADVSIMNYNLKLENIINKYFGDEILMIITRDQNDINSGNFIVKGKNDLIYKYISLWRDNLQNKYNYMGEQDQPSLINIILNTDFKKYVRIIDQSIINSYPDIPKNRNAKIYKQNDLLIHYAGYTWHNMKFNDIMKYNFFNSLKIKL